MSSSMLTVVPWSQSPLHGVSEKSSLPVAGVAAAKNIRPKAGVNGPGSKEFSNQIQRCDPPEGRS